MYTTKPKLSVHNRFIFELTDSRTGQLKQTAKAENVVLDTFYAVNNPLYRNKLRLGVGTGEPSITDTNLFSQKYILSEVTPTTSRVDDNTMLVDYVFTSPLGNVGDYTEVGFSANAYLNNTTSDYLITHAMITDSEGNPIAVKQTDTDILTVKAQLYFRLDIIDDLQTYVVPPYQHLKNWFSYATGHINYYGPLKKNTAYVGISQGLAWDDTSVYLGTRMLGYAIPNGTNKRFGVSEGNYGYYHYATVGLVHCIHDYVTLLGYIKFPNPTVFPTYTIADVPVSVGDGHTKQFTLPLDWFLQDTEIIYKNGIPLTRGVDYTVDHRSNPNLNRDVSAGTFATYNRPDWMLGVSKNYGASHNFEGCFFSHAVQIKYGYRGDGHYYYADGCLITPNSAMVVTLNEGSEFGMDVNYIRLPGKLGIPSTNSWNSQDYQGYYDSASPLSAGYMTVEYSTNGEDYTLLRKLDIVDGLCEPIALEQSITAKYWRFTAYDSNDNRIRLIANSTGSYFAHGGFLGHHDPYGLKFTVAPAEGDVITMDCQLDRPYKSSNYVIDLTGTVEYTTR